MCQKLAEIHNLRPENLLDYLPDSSNGCVDIDKILQQMNISIQKNTKRVRKTVLHQRVVPKGGSRAKGNDLVLFYNPSLTEKERRITLASEIAHCCVDMNVDSTLHMNVQKRSNWIKQRGGKRHRVRSKQERAARSYARELLVPSSSINSLLYNKPELSVEELSDYYKIGDSEIYKKLIEIKRNLSGTEINNLMEYPAVEKEQILNAINRIRKNYMRYKIKSEINVTKGFMLFFALLLVGIFGTMTTMITEILNNQSIGEYIYKYIVEILCLISLLITDTFIIFERTKKK